MGLTGGRGFMLAGLGFMSAGEFTVYFTNPHSAKWSEAAVAKHEAQVREAAHLVGDLKALGFERVGLDGGVAIGLRDVDPRPGWPIDSEQSLVVLTAQVAWLKWESR